MGVIGQLLRRNEYRLTCTTPQGFVRWHEVIFNLVVDEGLNDALDKHLKGVGYTASWFVGLTSGSPTIDPTDTMTAHPGWTEITDYDEATRPALVLGAVANQSVDSIASPALFTMNANVTAGGAFIVFDNAKAGTDGPLYGVAPFSADRLVVAGDVISYDATFTTAAV